MIDAISKLVESGAISEDVKNSIQEAWDNKIKENRETVSAELREEFAKRYEHDKSNMIEAIDKMMTEKLSEEITKFVEDRKALAQEKIALKQAANLYEALVGAIYLDGGLENAKKVIINTIWAHREHAWESVNFKGKLIELCHIKQMENPKFLVSNVSGPEHKKLFEVTVKIGNDIYPSGIGSNKKTAEQQAAQLAIDSISS